MPRRFGARPPSNSFRAADLDLASAGCTRLLSRVRGTLGRAGQTAPRPSQVVPWPWVLPLSQSDWWDLEKTVSRLRVKARAPGRCRPTWAAPSSTPARGLRSPREDRVRARQGNNEWIVHIVRAAAFAACTVLRSSAGTALLRSEQRRSASGEAHLFTPRSLTVPLRRARKFHHRRGARGTRRMTHGAEDEPEAVGDDELAAVAHSEGLGGAGCSSTTWWTNTSGTEQPFPGRSSAMISSSAPSRPRPRYSSWTCATTSSAPPAAAARRARAHPVALLAVLRVVGGRHAAPVPAPAVGLQRGPSRWTSPASGGSALRTSGGSARSASRSSAVSTTASGSLEGAAPRDVRRVARGSAAIACW